MIFSESGDNKIFYRGCMNPYPGYGIGECYEADYGYSKTKICFCGEDKCNGIDMWSKLIFSFEIQTDGFIF